MEVGIVGLPVSGKTTLFSTLTGQTADGGFGGGKIEVHRGIVKVPDNRLDELTAIFNPKKQVNTTIEYIEVGGMDSDSGQKGFDAQFLQVLKGTAALCVVIRAFENEFYPHPAGSIDPARDILTVEAEFLLSDLSIMETRIERLEKQLSKVKDEKNQRELELLKRCMSVLEEERPLREIDFTEDEATMLRGYQFLTAKPLVFVINYNESDIEKDAELLNSFQAGKNVSMIGLCGKVEQEISQLDDDDREMFMEELGIKEPASNKLIRTCYELLGLACFFTVGEDECRSWTIKENTVCQKAAGVIHSDLERGFIRAEVVGYKEFLELGSLSKARDEGKLRLEGKSYIVKDGDIMNVRFNV
ncbi:MAG: redox-regulated ATPase YchF [Calditrichia bacterium]